jgi:hypothetical protein
MTDSVLNDEQVESFIAHGYVTMARLAEASS